MGRGFWAASALLAAWMCAPPLAAATLPPSTLSALHNLWAATGGPSWTRCSAWTPGFDPCVQPWGIPEWTPPDEGNAIDVVPGWGREICFVCENNGSGLKGLNFVLNNMTGPLPASIGAFPRLAYLSLLDNHLEGPLPPALGNLTALTQLYMGHNDFVGGIPPELGRLSALTVLYINGNNLVGELPPELGNLTLLSQLGLTNNRLGGALPSSFRRLTALTQLYLSSNYFSGAVPTYLGSMTRLTHLSLVGNQFTGPLPASLANLTAMIELGLNFNHLNGSIPEWLSTLTQLTVLGLSGNNFSGSIPDSMGRLTRLFMLGMFENQLTGGLPDSFGNLTALETLWLSNNHLSGDSIPEGFSNLTLLSSIDLSSNQLSLTPTAMKRLFTGYNGLRTVDLHSNRITMLGPIFAGCNLLHGKLVAVLANNQIRDNGTGVKSALDSASSCAASITLILRNNSVTALPSGLLEFIGSAARACGFLQCTLVDAWLHLDVSFNPLATVDQQVLTGAIWPVRMYLRTTVAMIGLDVSSSTVPLDFPESLDLFSIPWAPSNDDGTNGSLEVILSNNSGVPITVVRALSVGTNAPGSLSVGLAGNGYTEIGPLDFAGSVATHLDLSNNAITSVADNAFVYNFFLRSLDLSHNQVTVLSTTFFSNLPAMERLVVASNQLVALPLTNNHISQIADAVDNPLQCAGYGATAFGCFCPHTHQLGADFCGYVRCTPVSTTDGCDNGTLFNRSDCSAAPWSTCVSGEISGQFYHDGSFGDITNCDVEFSAVQKKAYEVQPPLYNQHGTATSNRLCGVCSACPEGYSTAPCSPTADVVCSRELSVGDIAAIVLAVLLLGIGATFFALYGRSQKKRRYQTQSELELTERLLGDVQEEKERATDEVAVMEQAWVIEEGDLALGAAIGQGAYGTVCRGVWGHIPVAVKILRHPLDDLDPSVREDFDREVKFMRSIRHPHLLIFYGAGVDSKSRAFLVTELMKGSLKALLLAHETEIDWTQRLTFAMDIASGMAYLHDKGTVHRDLKADNCFLGEGNRVKVADFGTGKLASRMHERHAASHGSVQETSVDAELNGDAVAPTWLTAGDAVDRTLSKGVGSLLWMAPEVLQGSRLKERHAHPIDVYSYAIVLWEIWARARPWDEVQEEGIQFAAKLTELVCSGVRPQLPGGCEAAPEGYRAIVEQCWASDPSARPTFAAVTRALAHLPK